jgi:8-oxo-dGTP pyrophosphatase MutT (NUDIX family)
MPHINEKVDFTVEVFVVHKNKVLLRKHDKYKLWLSVGGHIEPGEDPNEAAIREVKEEVGLHVRLGHKRPLSEHNDFRELVPPRFMNRHRINAGHEHVTLVFFAIADSDKLRLSETELSDACRWFTREEVEDPKFQIEDHIKIYAKSALDDLGL